MKAFGKSVASLLRDPSRVAGILLYGSDTGLVRERSSRAAQAVLGETGGAFRFVALPREGHGKLRDEVLTLPLGGGRRVIRVQDAADGLAGPLESLTQQLTDVLILVEASSLTARSKLRLMAERNPLWAAVTCFPESTAVVAGEISQFLSQAGLTAAPDALAFLTEELGGDFARRQSELEKLTLFAADDGMVDFEQARACCAGQLEASLSMAVSAAMTGDTTLADRLLAELECDGATGPGLLAVLSMERYRMLKVRALMEQGSTPDEACRSLVPPIYPRQAASFLTALRRWPTARLQWLGQALRSADLSCKRAGSRDFTVAARLLTSLSMVTAEDSGLHERF